MNKKTVVIGASPNPERYSNMAVTRLRKNGYEVVALGVRDGKIADVEITKGTPEIPDVHTVTMYVGPARQPEYYDYIFSLNPKRIIFNPGTENQEFMQLAEQKGIEVVPNCTLVMLSISAF